MRIISFKHVPVLLEETVAGLKIKPDGIYVDATLGGGGHTSKILNKLTTGRLYAFDQDEMAINYNRERFHDAITAGKLTLVSANFRCLSSALRAQKIETVDGIIYDLGVSSPQFDDVSRGFSYRHDASLDMRMNQQQTLSAYQVVNEWSYQDLVRILYRYGEERFAKRIARAIVYQRRKAPITGTFQLVDLVKSAIPAAARRHGGHPAKKSFQAIRVAVNDELGALVESLDQAFKIIRLNGRMAVITFQPSEDRLVKAAFKHQCSLPVLPPKLPVLPEVQQPTFTLVNKKPILPSPGELKENRRSHSARLRLIMRTK